jgi:hypothetical protein
MNVRISVAAVTYLCSPYSHAEPAVREQRFRAACAAATALIRAGHVVFCPVVHSHPLVEHGLPIDWQSWERIDWAFLERCDEFVVLMLDGWEASAGVQAEIRIAGELGLSFRYLSADLAGGLPTLADVASFGPGQPRRQ